MKRSMIVFFSDAYDFGGPICYLVIDAAWRCLEGQAYSMF